jgi:hypothetical protein
MKIYIKNNPAATNIHIIWGPIALLVIAAAGFFKDFLDLLPPCIFHKVTGVPCLTCGATRSIVALSRLDFASSFLHNPLTMIFAIALVVFSSISLFGYIIKKSLVLKFSEREKRALRIGAVALIALNWLFLIATDV